VTPTNAEFWRLAASHGISSSYTDAKGDVQRSSPEVVISILRALGVPLEVPGDAASLSSAEEAAGLRRCLEPVMVHRIGRRSRVVASVPTTCRPDTMWLTIQFERGDSVRFRLPEAIAGIDAGAEADGVRYERMQLDLARPIAGPFPPGRHQVTLEGAGSFHRSLLLSAPDCPSARRQTCAFMPLHALRSLVDWGIGSYTDLERLSRWAASEGCGLVGTLPLYPAFLDPPADPSPYLPVSRLAYNEVFIDPVALPEFSACGEARELCSSASFRERLTALRSSTLADYEQVARLKRIVLELLAQVVTSGALPRRQDALAEFIRARPELEGYARFRANLDSPTGEDGPSAVTYHLYAQWAAYEQLLAAGRHAGRYADFPIGSHPAGFDPVCYPDSFVPDLHGGAPPDRFFPLGQDWGFRPLHPERIREDGYAFLSAALRRAFLHADCLRIDHVMGLERLFMIPEGSAEGAYVSYRAEELHALVALEASRAGAVVVGEDLGTVPEEVRPRMARDGILRTWVFQFESTSGQPLPSPPAESLVALGTHDLPRFGAYLWGDDIDEREEDGLLSRTDAQSERRSRKEWRQSLFESLGLSDSSSDAEKLTTAALEGCLLTLSRSDAAILLVDLQEAWGERGQDNVPGSVPGGPNWRRRSSRTIEEIESDHWAAALLQEMTTGRQA
jgi:4-alpha-glucanotransferase